MSSDYHDVPHSVRVALSHLQSSPAPSHFSMISDNPSPQQDLECGSLTKSHFNGKIHKGEISIGTFTMTGT